MSTLIYDLCILTPADISIDIVGSAIEGARSLSGVTQAINYSGGGFVAATYGGIYMSTPAQHKYWNQLAAVLNGSTDFIRVPLWTDLTRPASTAGTVNVTAALGDTVFEIGLLVAPEAGQWFDIDHGGAMGRRAYRILSVTHTTSTFYSVEVRPPLRANTASGTAINFNRPLCRMRLPAGETMAWHWTAPGGISTEASINFVEYF